MTCRERCDGEDDLKEFQKTKLDEIVYEDDGYDIERYLSEHGYSTEYEISSMTTINDDTTITLRLPDGSKIDVNDNDFPLKPITIHKFLLKEVYKLRINYGGSYFKDDHHPFFNDLEMKSVIIEPNDLDEWIDIIQSEEYLTRMKKIKEEFVTEKQINPDIFIYVSY